MNKKIVKKTLGFILFIMNMMILVSYAYEYADDYYEFDIETSEIYTLEKKHLVEKDSSKKRIRSFAVSENGELAIVRIDNDIDIYEVTGGYLYTYKNKAASSVIRYNKENQLEKISYRNKKIETFYADGSVALNKISKEDKKLQEVYEFLLNRKEIYIKGNRYYKTSKYPITQYIMKNGYTQIRVENEQGEIQLVYDGSKYEFVLIIWRILIYWTIVVLIIIFSIYFFKVFDPNKIRC